MDRQPVLSGDRLLLRPLRPDDWAALFAVASDPLIWELHPAHDRWQEPVFRDLFGESLASGAAMVVIDRASGAVIGSSRWDRFDPAASSVEVGWTFLARSHWGGAWNRELKRLMLAHAFRFVNRARFRVGEANHRSRRAMEKIGGRLTDEVEVVERGGALIVHVTYEIDAKSFAAGPLSP